MIQPRNAAVFTDLYELTMLQSYVRDDIRRTAAFDLFVRRLRERNFLLVCGLDDALSYLEALRFTPEQLDYLDGLPQFDREFVEWLADFRFTGDVYAMQEGTPVFADEPLLEVVAPLPEAQLVETALLNQITYQTNVASRAARIVHAAAGRPIAEFGMRRIHGADAALMAARAAYIAGADSTSNVLAGLRFGIKLTGTMAHSFIQVHGSEMEAFRSFTSLYPGTTLLVDTFDTLEAVRSVVDLYHRLEEEKRFAWIRLDSGDLAQLSREARRILDAGGLHAVGIIASNSLDEYRIQELIRSGAPIDAFGVGTRLGTVSDMPYLDTVYKLVEYDGQPRMKLSADKTSSPGRKQVFRESRDGRAYRDVLTTVDDEAPGQPLLTLVMQGGRRTEEGRATIEDARRHARESISRLPERLHALEPAKDAYPVEISEVLQKKTDELARSLAR